MKLHIISIGEPKLSFAKEGITEYFKRLSGLTSVELTHIKEGKKEDEKVLKAIGKHFCVLLDENGREYTSRELALFFEKKENQAVSDIALVIGGPNGHTGVVKERADHVISLSRLTLPHDMALLFLLESVYRAFSINANHPYHRD